MPLKKRYKQNLVKSLKSKDHRLIGTYIGIWAGDGTQYYDNGYRIKICCHSKDQRMIGFFRWIMMELFGKTVTDVVHEERNRSLIRFNSKFIYDFVNYHLLFDEKKTHTVRLKDEIKDYSEEYLEGFLLGLTLTDGYLKDKYCFNVTSKELASNCFQILKGWNLNPKMYIHNREKYGWKDLHMVRLDKKNSRILKQKMDYILKTLGYNMQFEELKYQKSGPAETFSLSFEALSDDNI